MPASSPRKRRWQRAGQFGAALCFALLTTSVQAHSTIKGIPDFYAGALHPLTAFEDVLPFVAMGVLCGQLKQSARATLAECCVAMFCAGLLVGAAAALEIRSVPATDLVNIISALVLGALVALAIRLPGTVYLTLALIFGLSHGYASGMAIEPPINPSVFIPGVCLAGFVVTFYVMLATEYVLRRQVGWMTVAVRVAGSWIAATGLLVLATSWKRLIP